MNECRCKVALANRYETWWNMIRLSNRWKREQLNKQANDIFNKEMPLQFAGWWVLKKERENISLPFPETEHLIQFLNEPTNEHT